VVAAAVDFDDQTEPAPQEVDFDELLAVPDPLVGLGLGHRERAKQRQRRLLQLAAGERHFLSRQHGPDRAHVQQPLNFGLVE
jgi:hypothetical protein